ncbi:MAG: ABC transporter ATP-binding protein, partial [Pseudomonadota bacterium]
LAVIRHMSDRVAVMYLGKIVETGPTDAIFERPQHPYTEALLAAIPIPAVGVRKAKVAVEGDPPDPISLPTGCRFHTRCPYATDHCRSAEPPLRDLGGGRSAACHFSGDIALSGIRSIDTGRSDAARRRFDLYAAARAAANDNNTKDPPNSKERPHAHR